MHAIIRSRMPVTDIVFCPHDNQDRCRCRKPRPGMILDTCSRLDLDPTTSIMVGDQPRDIEAGRAAGCRTILVSPPTGSPGHPRSSPIGDAVRSPLRSRRSSPS